MIGRRLIWPNYRPVPFESGWSVCGMVLVINRMRATELANLVRLRPQEKVNLRSGEGVDLAKLSALLNIKEERLRQGYMASLGFSGARLPKHVSHCPLCLDAGYHSVFFEWEIVDTCPIHHFPLFKCPYCAFLTQSGPKRLRRERESTFDFRDEFIGDVYHSTCKHVLFDVSEPIHNLEVDQGLLDQYISLGQEMSSWLDQVKVSKDTAQPVVACFNQYRRGLDLDYRSDIMRRVAGGLPIHKRYVERNGFRGLDQHVVKPKPASLMSWKQSGGGDTLKHDQPNSTGEIEIGPLLKSVYRHVFKRFVRGQHARCWKEFRKLDYFQAHELSLEKTCLVCVAFATWAMGAKRVCNVETFRKPYTASFSDSLGYLAEYNHPAAHTHIWFAQFVFILDELERVRREAKRIHIVQRNFTSPYKKLFLTQGDTEDGITPFWIMLPNIDHLQRISDSQCWARPSSLPTMLLNYKPCCFWDETSFDESGLRGSMFYIFPNRPHPILHTLVV
jgi:hypothetical protein